jgi:hypothetical protein
MCCRTRSMRRSHAAPTSCQWLSLWAVAAPEYVRGPTRRFHPIIAAGLALLALYRPLPHRSPILTAGDGSAGRRRFLRGAVPGSGHVAYVKKRCGLCVSRFAPGAPGKQRRLGERLREGVAPLSAAAGPRAIPGHRSVLRSVLRAPRGWRSGTPSRPALSPRGVRLLPGGRGGACRKNGGGRARAPSTRRR